MIFGLKKRKLPERERAEGSYVFISEKQFLGADRASIAMPKLVLHCKYKYLFI